jgi:hypothetical protein
MIRETKNSIEAPVDLSFGSPVPGVTPPTTKRTPLDQAFSHPLMQQVNEVCAAIEACGSSPLLVDAHGKADALRLELWAALASQKIILSASPDEPTFTLRAQDKSAPFVVMKWAETASQNGVSPEKIVGAQKIAFNMIEWQQRNGCKVPD